MIIVENLAKSFGSVTALNGVSLTADTNKITGIIGPDGSGKTSLLRILACVMKFNSGRVEIGGLNVSSDRDKIKKIIGYVPRDYGLYGDLSVDENINFYADLFGVRGKLLKDRKHELLLCLDLERFADRQSRFLSGGMKQKLQLACALIHRPKYLILDEPSYGVDPVSRKKFWSLLTSFVNEATILVSTSYMDEAGYFDDIILLNKGKAMISGDLNSLLRVLPDQIFAVRCKNLYESLNRTKFMYKSVNLYGYRMHVIFKEGCSDLDVRKELSSDFIDSESIQPSLEDVFIYLTSLSC